MPATAPDLAPYRTADGSCTLRSTHVDEHYHSVVGAVNESTHVFVQSGLEHVLATQPQRPVKLFEVGLGRGLNRLLPMQDNRRRSVGVVGEQSLAVY